jgi:histidinol dehydrogenase
VTTIVSTRFAVVSTLAALGDTARRTLLERSTSCDPAIRDRTAAIIDRVRGDGDVALRALARELDGVDLASLEVPRDQRRAALRNLEPTLRRALERAAANIATVHRASLPSAMEVETEPGVHVGRRPDPLGRVGVYAPGGRATYPSSVLMGAVPARVAGVGEVILCSPPRSSGQPSDAVLAAAELAGVDRVFSIGGAGAIAAMAHGTASVPRVDRIVGPGNAYVAEAKLQLAGVVGIDAPAGPSELLVIADATAVPAAVAREMLAQAEHDSRTAVVLIAIGEDVADRITAAVEAAIAAAPRAPVIEDALASRGAVLIAPNLDDAVRFANEYAAEHLLLALADGEAALDRLRNTGMVFIGMTSSVTYGDYMTGANHVLPTGGLARTFSGLSVLDFVRWTSWQRVSPPAAARLADDVRVLAEAEGLPAHAAAALWWRTAGDAR